MPVFSGNCEECGAWTSTYCVGSLTAHRVVKVIDDKSFEERVIFCPVCAKTGKKKLKHKNREMKGVK